jgi:hypothetical protein
MILGATVIVGWLNVQAVALATPEPLATAITGESVSPRSPLGRVAQSLQGETVTLPTVGWQPVAEGTVLGPWDMLWIRPGGRAEIEITRDGQIPIRDHETDVRSADGGWTKKKRFRGTFYFIMVPMNYLEAKVDRVIGPVFVATDQERVKAFYGLYHSPQGGGGWSSAEEVIEWRRLLREGEELK